MKMALANGDREAAQLVACDCVVLAETKDHQNWELIGHVAEHGQGEETAIGASRAEHQRDDMLRAKH